MGSIQKKTEKKQLKLLFLIIVITCLNLVTFQAKAQITTGTLVEEMVDLKQLAEYPSPFYNTVQFSSYDRRSTSPDAPGWFSNADGFGREPIPGFEKVLKKPNAEGIGEYLICDVKNPGAIVRLWTAAIYGEVKLFLDDNPEPVYSGNAHEFFTHAYKAIAKETNVDFDGSFTQNTAGYYPIPFAKRCKIIWIGKLEQLHFYHVNIRMYEKGTKVKTFKLSDLESYSKQIVKAKNVLDNPEIIKMPGGSETNSFAVDVDSNQKQEVLKIKGGKGIHTFEMKVLDADQETALRQTVLKISFDGAAHPQVQSPVGDFFGTAAGINPYQSLPFTVKEDGTMVCRYYMPFKDSATVVIENLGGKTVTCTGKISTEDYQWNDKKSMYFRARWRVDHDLTSSEKQASDIAYLLTSGKGVCVGAAAHMLNPTNVPSVYGNWWGEGDEKIFVDDNPFPVFFGTGSEDYFNYAWSSPDLFDYAYCGQTRDDGPGTKGFITNYRWHIIDNIPFENHFAFYMELLSHETVPGYSYARIVYHYGFRGIHDDNKWISKGDVRKLELPDNWYPIAKKGSYNSTFYQAEDLVGTNENISFIEDRLWSGNKLLLWQPENKSEKLEINLPIPQDGKYAIHLTMQKSNVSGGFAAKVEGTDFFKDPRSINLNTSSRELSRTFTSQVMELKKGIQKLTLEPVTSNQPIGIDFIWIQKR